MVYFKIKMLFSFLLISISLFAQSRTNFEMLNSLVDSSTLSISSQISDSRSEYKLEFQTISEYLVLNKRAENSFVRNGIKISFDNGASKLSYSILRATVNYSDLFKDGLFGGYSLERKFILSGEYKFENSLSILNADTFYFSITDTIPYGNINLVENNSLPFTHSRIPSEPFLPSIFEPIVAITAVVITVVLFFTVRSN